MRRAAILMAAVALAAAGCGGTAKISKDEIEKQVQAYFDKLAQQGGQAKFPDITCPKDLEAKVGESERCSATGTDGTLGITVTVDKVEGGKAHFHFKADDKLTK